MHQPVKSLSLITVTIFLSLVSPVSLKGTSLKISEVQVQAQTNQNLKAEADRLLQQGIQQRGVGQLDAALQSLQQALIVYKELKDRSGEGQVLQNLGNVYNAQKDYRNAIEYYQQALTLARELKERSTEAVALALIGSAYDSLNEKQKVIEYYQQALTLARETKNVWVEAIALYTLSRTYNSLGDAQKTVEFAQQTLAVARQLKNQLAEGQSLVFLANAYDKLNDYQHAVENAEASLALAREINNLDLEKPALLSLLSTYIELGDYQKVIDFAQQGSALAEKTQNRQYKAAALFYLSLAHFGRGNYQQTIEFAQQTLKIAQEVKSPPLESLALLALGIGYGDLNQSEKSLQFVQQCLTSARQQQNEDLESLALNILGGIYNKLGKREQAITAYQEAMAINSDYSIKAGIARVYRDLNMPITAITYYKQAVNQIEGIRQNIRGLPLELQKSFLQAVQSFDRIKTSGIYRDLADFLLSQGRILEAQQVLELLKVQELRDYTKDTRAGGKKTEVALNQTEEQIKEENGTLIAFGQRLYECQQTRCNQLSQLLDQREALTEQFNHKIQTIEKQVRDRKSQDDAFLDPNKLGLKAKEIVEAQPGTVLIYPLVLEDKIWLLWASKGGIVKTVEVPKVGQKQLAQTVLKFRQLLQTPSSNITELQATGKQLYNWLIKPIELELKENKVQNLVFSLDRATRYIPMSALFDGKKYLIENYAISTVISADLTNTSDRIPPGTQNTSVLALGLSKAVPGFNPLPNVPAELDAIVRKQPNDTQGIYPGLEFLNQDFNWRSLRDNLLGHKLLHIATHGEFVPGSPDASYLLLGTGEKLAIPKIATLQDLSNVSLVVLSACETALAGTGQDGTEINGISYYFLNSGAKAVMASLWSVNDDSTRLLMQNFYGNLAKGTSTTPITKAQALQQAQLSLLHGESSTTTNSDQRASLAPEARPGSPTTTTNSTSMGFSHPYYWAPFILIGNSL